MKIVLHLAKQSEAQHGVFTRRQAVKLGLTTDMIDRRLANGQWVRIHRCVYRFAGVPSSGEMYVMAAVLAAGPGTCASHLTAAALWQLDVPPVGRLEVSVADRRDLRLNGVIVHRPRALTVKDRTRLGVVPVTTPMRTILDVSAVVTPTELELALDAALRRRLVRLRPLAARIASTLPSGRRGIPALRRLLVEREGDKASESALETLFLRLARRAGLPKPSAQFVVTRADGSFVARVDFAYPSVRLAIEIDGYAFHEGRQRWDRDRVRQNELVDQGWIVLRFTKTDIEHREAAIVTAIQNALDRTSGLG